MNKTRTIISFAATALASAAGADEPALFPNQKLFDPFEIQNDHAICLTAEFLAWKSFQDGLQFSIENSHGTASVTHGHVKNPDPKWGFGFRAGFDVRLPIDKWDLNTKYTYFEGVMKSDVSAPSGGALFPSWQFPASSTVFATHAKASWHCNLNTADLELGRFCHVGKWLGIRPYMGLKGAIIQQRYHVTYRGGSAVPVGDQDRIKLSNDFWGIGLRFGFNSLWGLGQGISLYADGAGSLLSGHFTMTEREHLNVHNTTIYSLRDKNSTVVPVAEVALGLQWDRFFSGDRYHFGVKLGWELNYFFNQNRLIRFVSSTSPGAIVQNNNDLSFMGITLGVRLDF